MLLSETELALTQAAQLLYELLPKLDKNPYRYSDMASTQRYIDLRPAMLKAAVELV